MLSPYELNSSSSLSGSPSGHWLPLVDYAVKHQVSLSTLRRYIKADKIMYRLESGRYLIWEDAHSVTRLSALENELQRAKEEIAELKTLIAFYEAGAQPRADL